MNAVVRCRRSQRNSRQANERSTPCDGGHESTCDKLPSAVSPTRARKRQRHSPRALSGERRGMLHDNPDWHVA